MATVNVHDADAHLSSLVERAEGGEEIIIVRGGEPIAQLVRLPKRSAQPRTPGFWKGKIHIADDFDAPLPDEIRRAFMGDDE